jgi:peptidoglycan/xylan/chitin deacetylase (PgdA/CDA1 family)
MRTAEHFASKSSKSSPSMLSHLRSSLRHASVRALRIAGELRAARKSVAASGDRVVLTFHRIVPDKEIALCRSPRGMVLRESIFAQVIEYLKFSTSIEAPERVEWPHYRTGRPQVILTFDDGWIDNLDIALPYLTSAGIRACFFMTTGFAGQAEPFWPERLRGIFDSLRWANMLPLLQEEMHELESRSDIPSPAMNGSTKFEEILTWLKQFPTDTISQWLDTLQSHLSPIVPNLPAGTIFDPRERLMDWDELQQLAAAGHTIGSHTRSHALLTRLDPHAIREELLVSREHLREHLHPSNEAPIWLSYPNGDASHAIAASALRTGYSRAFLNSPGLWRKRTSQMLIPRVNVWDGTVTGRSGDFSPEHLEYSLFWKTARTHTKYK